MKTAVALALLAGSAAAFAPQQTSQRSATAVSMGYENELGVQPPLGFWDPLNLLDGADEAEFNRLRSLEIKHGRIAMLAVAGHIATTQGVRLPGNIDLAGTSFASIKTGIAGLSDIPPLGLAQIIAFIGFLDVFVMKDYGKGEYPGDLRNGLFKWDASESEKNLKRAVELNNGRAAQMGILGLITHELISGEPYVANTFFGYSSHFNEGL